MNPNPDPNDNAWLDEWLAPRGEPLADDGFSARVMQRVDALTAPAPAAAPARCVPADAALRRLTAVTRREQHRQFWNTAGVLAAAGIGLLTLWTQPAPIAAIALVLASAALPWLLLRDPQF
ncbi:MAG: hypothetical protein ABI781_00190 [Burkholderiales bacterium]